MELTILQQNLPASHLKITGDAPPTFIIIWFLIALWTFADPGFHQRAYAAKTGNVAKNGILISIIFFALFDFLTTSTGLYARALIPNLNQPVNAFPLLAEQILSPGLKGIFYAAMFATIISTLNSFLFLSATTIGRDFIFKLKKNAKEEKVKNYTILGIILSGVISIVIALAIPSVVEIWYTIGSLFIPGIIFPVISAYYQKFRISSNLVVVEMVTAIGLSSVWIIIRSYQTGIISEIEPMIIGLLAAFFIHSIGLIRKSFSFN